jgi:toxin YoeB
VEVIFSPGALEDLQYWKKSGNVKVINKISTLLEEIQNYPFEGTGKPEPLRHDWSGYWSRHITQEHRMGYKVQNDSIFIAQLRYHY